MWQGLSAMKISKAKYPQSTICLEILPNPLLGGSFYVLLLITGLASVYTRLNDTCIHACVQPLYMFFTPSANLQTSVLYQYQPVWHRESHLIVTRM